MLDDIVRQTLGDGSILAYVALFFGIMLENAGIPLPGETALLVAGYLTSEAGGYRLHLWAVIVVACLAAVVGDNLGFWLGRKLARPRLAAGKRFLFLTPARFQQAERYFAKYGAVGGPVADRGRAGSRGGRDAVGAVPRCQRGRGGPLGDRHWAHRPLRRPRLAGDPDVARPRGVGLGRGGRPRICRLAPAVSNSQAKRESEA
jgi:hypothetical protein